MNLRLTPLLLLILVVAACTSTVDPLTPITTQAAWNVDSNVDSADVSPGDGVCADSGGACTLRAAIQEANALAGGDSIDLPAGTYTLTIAGAGEDAGATGDLDITDDLTIVGAGATITVLDGSGLAGDDRILQVMSGAVVELAGIALTGGGGPLFGGNGGAVSNQGSLTLSRSVVDANASAGFGGGLFSRGALTLSDSTVSNNHAALDGGGILSSGTGTLNVTGSIVSGNSGRRGGGFSHESGVATLIDSVVQNNEAVSSGISDGGGVYNGGTLTLTDTDVTDNRADVEGGGIDNSFGVLTIVGGSVSGNSAAIGGGINNEFGTATLTDTAIFDNLASDRGGGISNDGFADADEPSILQVTGGDIHHNTSSSGGGIDNRGEVSSVTLIDSTIEFNDRYGVRNFDGATLTVQGSSIGNNVLSGILNDFGGIVTLERSTIGNNSGIGLENPIGTAIVRESSVHDNGFHGLLSDGTLSLSGSTVSGNGGHGIFNDAGTLTLDNSTISGNTSSGVVNENDVIANFVTIAANGGYGIDNGASGSDSVSLNASIVAGNAFGDCRDPNLGIGSGGHNLDGDGTCPLLGPGDLSGANPGLEPLQDNGGPTATHGLGSGSDAPDRISEGVAGCGTLVTSDQRGVDRPQRGACDIGAFERLSPQDLIADLIEDIASLADGGLLKNGESKQLSRPLKRAERALDRGQAVEACAQLRTFIHEVETAVAQGILPPAEADPLIDEAGQIETLLGCAP